MENTIKTTKLNNGIIVLAGKDGYAKKYCNITQAENMLNKLTAQNIKAEIYQNFSSLSVRYIRIF